LKPEVVTGLDIISAVIGNENDPEFFFKNADKGKVPSLVP
jgi:hypothetical protein